MTTSPNTTPTTGSGLGFWKILGIIAVVLLALAMIGPLLKGLFWVALIGLAAYGGWILLRSRAKSNDNHPTPL